MKGIFCYDGPISKDSNGNYYGVALNNTVLSRYYEIADELTLAIRTRNQQDKNILKNLSKIELDKFKVVSCPNISSFKGVIFNRSKVKKILKSEISKVDFVIVRLPSFIGNISIDIAKKLNKPYYVELVGCPWDGFWNLGIKGKIVAPYMKFSTKRRVRDSKYVSYVTSKFLQDRYPTDGKSISCSNVALKNFDDITLNKRIEHINSKDNDDIKIIGTTAAVNVRFKGQQYVIEAISKLKENGNSNYIYQIVGAGDQTYLRKVASKYGVEDQVEFLGPMKHDEVFEWLENIDIYIQPSRQEGLPRALIEAMSKGLPSLGARTAGIPELLSNDFIFSNTKNNIEEICNILGNLDKDQMIKQSYRNYSEAKKYDSYIIERRRKKFLKDFIENYKGKVN